MQASPGTPSLLFRPTAGWLGDVAPLFIDGAFHLFFTRLRYDEEAAPGRLKALDWGHLVSRDLVTFEELPDAITNGGPESPDAIVGAGSVVRASDGTFVAYYCGINPVRVRDGQAGQVVLRATSPDLVTWTKDEDFVLEADTRWYDRDDWRDPFVVRRPDGWEMLLCARVRSGAPDRRGCIGLASSPDLIHWDVHPPLLRPGITFAPECPELFETHGRERLVYSTYSDRFETRYRIRSDAGAWLRPPWDALESGDVYAIKTASDGERRYMFGWLATRAGDRDSGHRQWGGDLVVHELIERSDGTLRAGPVASLISRFHSEAVTPEPYEGTWTVEPEAATFDGPGFGWCSLGRFDGPSLADVTVDLRGTAEEIGVAIRATDDFGAAYLLRLEPDRGRVVFDRRPHRISVPFELGADRAYVSAADHEIERPLHAHDGQARVRAVVDGSAIVTYVNDVALTTRGYDLTDGHLAIYAANGRARFTHCAAGTLKSPIH